VLLWGRGCDRGQDFIDRGDVGGGPALMRKHDACTAVDDERATALQEAGIDLAHMAFRTQRVDQLLG
jgi:hypothetical protein